MLNINETVNSFFKYLERQVRKSSGEDFVLKTLLKVSSTKSASTGSVDA